MSKPRIMLGWSPEERPVDFDLETLRASHLLIIGASGSGKSYTMRVIAEQCYGEIPVIIIDPESEYRTLREKFGFVLVSKTDGDAPATVQSAEMMAHKLLELRASAICSLYELPMPEQHAWVSAFVTGLMNAPKSMWRPTLVMVDEAHKFCPEQGEGHSVAKEAMTDFASRGRKHEFGIVLGTQRVTKLDNNAASECQNWLLGRTFLPTDRDRAAKVFGIPQGKAREEFFHHLKLLKKGTFHAQGVAISADMVTVRVQKAQTRHNEPGTHVHSAPPAPESIRGILSALADIPKEAQEKAQTIEALRKDVKRLEGELRAAKRAEAPQQVNIALVKDHAAEMDKLKRQLRSVQKDWSDYSKDLHYRLETLETEMSNRIGIIRQRPAPVIIDAPAAPPTIVAEPLKVQPPPRAMPDASAITLSNGDFKKAELELLAAMARLDAIGRARIPRRLLAIMAGVSPRSSSFESNVGRLSREGYFAVGDGMVAFTQKGRSAAPQVDCPATTQEMFAHLESILSASEFKLVDTLRCAASALGREELATQAGVSPRSSSFEGNIGTLTSIGVLEIPVKGEVCLADWLFID